MGSLPEIYNKRNVPVLLCHEQFNTVSLLVNLYHNFCILLTNSAYDQTYFDWFKSGCAFFAYFASNFIYFAFSFADFANLHMNLHVLQIFRKFDYLFLHNI